MGKQARRLDSARHRETLELWLHHKSGDTSSAVAELRNLPISVAYCNLDACPTQADAGN